MNQIYIFSPRDINLTSGTSLSSNTSELLLVIPRSPTIPLHCTETETEWVQLSNCGFLIRWGEEREKSFINHLIEMSRGVQSPYISWNISLNTQLPDQEMKIISLHHIIYYTEIFSLAWKNSYNVYHMINDRKKKEKSRK